MSFCIVSAADARCFEYLQGTRDRPRVLQIHQRAHVWEVEADGTRRLFGAEIAARMAHRPPVMLTR